MLTCGPVEGQFPGGGGGVEGCLQQAACLATVQGCAPAARSAVIRRACPNPLLPARARLQEFVAGLDGLPDDAKAALAAMTPATYVGNAEHQAKALKQHLKR